MRFRWVFLTAVLLAFGLCWNARGESDLHSHYDNDFILETTDGDFQLKLRGNLHTDGRLYQAAGRGSPHSIDLRRGRIDLQGRIHDFLTFRLQPELVGDPYLRNAWVDAEVAPWLHIRVGQMKVPFSTSWATLDNNVNFIERATSTPVYPFFDRGVLLWGNLGSTLVYNLGAFTGAGLDIDTPSGDQDDAKDIAARLFVQPFAKGAEPIRGLFVVGQGTWGRMFKPTRRYELGGLRSANFETAVWRWRTEQVLGTNGRTVDSVTAVVDSRFRWGAELHYLLSWLSLSAEYLELRYEGIRMRHELHVGSSRVARDRLFETDGTIRSGSIWLSVYFTGESKKLTNAGWKSPQPQRNVGDGGPGALEALVRYSVTDTDVRLFDRFPVAGFAPGDPLLTSYNGATPGVGESLSAAVLDGANRVHELTLGFCWTLNPMARIQVNDVFLWTPFDDRNGDGENDNLLLSGAKSSQADPTKRVVKTRWENAVMIRLIFKI